jgi:hypothetical protein
MKKLLNLCLLLTSLIGYLEWGKNEHSFLFEAEAGLFSKLLTDPMAALHPLTVLPFTGQLILLYTLFQKQPGRVLTYTGLACLSLLLVFIFIIGLLSLNISIAASAVPFIITGVLVLRHYKKTRHTQNI